MTRGSGASHADEPNTFWATFFSSCLNVLSRKYVHGKARSIREGLGRYQLLSSQAFSFAGHFPFNPPGTSVLESSLS